MSSPLMELQTDCLSSASGPSLPTVSVVIPCLNEAQTITRLLENLADQYDPQRYEILVVDGMSSDDTRALVRQYIQDHPEISVKLVDNPAKHIPIALNLGIAIAKGDVIVRMDAHSIPCSNYIRQCVASLHNWNATIVGMPWKIEPGAETLIAKGIALASAHPFGVGDAQYRRFVSGLPVLVDTVPFGVFRKITWARLQGFNANLHTNEDYDFNYRARQSGGRVLLDRTGYSTYFARPTFSDLARQYFRYGRWKVEMLRLHPESLRARQLAAPLFVLLTVLLTLLSLRSGTAMVLLGGLLLCYFFFSVFFASRISWKEKELRLAPVVASAFGVMHVSWGASFLWSLFCTVARTKNELATQSPISESDCVASDR
jgi:succinoglycan biosynthesis protein ExoA